MYFKEHNGEMRLVPESQKECNEIECNQCAMEGNCGHKQNDLHMPDMPDIINNFINRIERGDAQQIDKSELPPGLLDEMKLKFGREPTAIYALKKTPLNMGTVSFPFPVDLLQDITQGLDPDFLDKLIRNTRQYKMDHGECDGDCDNCE